MLTYLLKNSINSSENFSHYTQSSIHFDNRNKMKGDVHLVGVKDEDDKVIAGCLLTEARSLNSLNISTHIGSSNGL